MYQRSASRNTMLGLLLALVPGQFENRRKGPGMYCLHMGLLSWHSGNSGEYSVTSMCDDVRYVYFAVYLIVHCWQQQPGRICIWERRYIAFALLLKNKTLVNLHHCQLHSPYFCSIRSLIRDNYNSLECQLKCRWLYHVKFWAVECTEGTACTMVWCSVSVSTPGIVTSVDARHLGASLSEQ